MEFLVISLACGSSLNECMRMMLVAELVVVVAIDSSPHALLSVKMQGLTKVSNVGFWENVGALAISAWGLPWGLEALL